MSGVKWKGNWIKRRLLSIEPTGDGIVRYLCKNLWNKHYPEDDEQYIRSNYNRGHSRN